jgi:hypothetical protein
MIFLTILTARSETITIDVQKNQHGMFCFYKGVTYYLVPETRMREYIYRYDNFEFLQKEIEIYKKMNSQRTLQRYQIALGSSIGLNIGQMFFSVGLGLLCYTVARL